MLWNRTGNGWEIKQRYSTTSRSKGYLNLAFESSEDQNKTLFIRPLLAGEDLRIFYKNICEGL